MASEDLESFSKIREDCCEASHPIVNYKFRFLNNSSAYGVATTEMRENIWFSVVLTDYYDFGRAFDRCRTYFARCRAR